MKTYGPEVLRDANGRPLLVFAKGRTLYHIIEACDSTIRVNKIPTLRGLRPLELRGNPYPPRRAASFWLNRDHRTITPRARSIMRGLVARKAVTA
jgi:hypothetical protein